MQYLVNQIKCTDRNEQMICDQTDMLISAPPMPLLYSLTTVGQGIAHFVADPFFILLTDHSWLQVQ